MKHGGGGGEGSRLTLPRFHEPHSEWSPKLRVHRRSCRGSHACRRSSWSAATRKWDSRLKTKSFMIDHLKKRKENFMKNSSGLLGWSHDELIIFRRAYQVERAKLITTAQSYITECNIWNFMKQCGIIFINLVLFLQNLLNFYKFLQIFMNFYGTL